MSMTGSDLLPVLRAEDLTCLSETGQPLVRDVSFEIQKGSFLAIAGPNGAGKTTLLRLLAGLLVPSAGAVFFKGKALKDIHPRKRARLIAYVGQMDKPDTRLSIREYVSLGRIPHSTGFAPEEHRQKVDQALEKVRLLERSEDRLGLLSGGEMQRASLARAFCQEPEILFLDEPTNHLDPLAKGLLLSLVAESGVTCISVLHDLALIPPIATHALLLEKTSMVAFDQVEKVLTQSTVQRVFGVDFLYLNHPEQERKIPVLDIPLTRRDSEENGVAL
ncbi:ABC transporter ATP-binding protein [Kiloniella sp. b19]|uniref:ABC transporter ATP-binding protein n=1 Tax=Kiloniella sp. GXU_MW_B19 TaxID=3141326 RepID=UPI0031D4C5A7